MANCRRERKAKTKSTIRGMAKELGATENYLSAVENGREFPSLKLFLSYLLLNGFEVGCLKDLKISKLNSTAEKVIQNKISLMDKIYSLNDEQVKFMAQQAKIADKLYEKKKRSK